MAHNGTVAYVSTLPPCDFDATHAKAAYDGKTTMGPWAYMCNACYSKYGVGIGTGLGQQLAVRKEEVDGTV